MSSCFEAYYLPGFDTLFRIRREAGLRSCRHSPPGCTLPVRWSFPLDLSVGRMVGDNFGSPFAEVGRASLLELPVLPLLRNSPVP